MARPTVYHSLLGALEARVAAMPRGAVLPPEQRLAEECGVSKPTLRRALAELAQRGLIAAENGVGNIALGARSAMRRELIFLCHNINFYSKTLVAFGEAVRAENYFFSIVPLDGDAFTQQQIVEAVAERNPSGLVIYADRAHGDLPVFRELAAGDIPLLFLIHCPAAAADRASLITLGIAEEISRIVCRLYDSGCRKFAFYGDELWSKAMLKERFAGFLDGMRRCRLKPQERLQCLAADGIDEFLLQFDSPAAAPDAVCCMSDNHAAELMDRLRRRGVDISGIRFSGFDHQGMLKYLPHPVLTVELPMVELGREAAGLILRQIENRSFKPLQKNLSCRIVES